MLNTALADRLQHRHLGWNHGPALKGRVRVALPRNHRRATVGQTANGSPHGCSATSPENARGSGRDKKNGVDPKRHALRGPCRTGVVPRRDPAKRGRSSSISNHAI
jgi:hypothetical protein